MIRHSGLRKATYFMEEAACPVDNGWPSEPHLAQRMCRHISFLMKEGLVAHSQYRDFPGDPVEYALWDVAQVTGWARWDAELVTVFAKQIS